MHSLAGRCSDRADEAKISLMTLRRNPDRRRRKRRAWLHDEQSWAK
jgi:hypothetical protein